MIEFGSDDDALYINGSDELTHERSLDAENVAAEDFVAAGHRVFVPGLVGRVPRVSQSFFRLEPKIRDHLSIDWDERVNIPTSAHKANSLAVT